jgi:hypothetical protein
MDIEEACFIESFQSLCFRVETLQEGTELAEEVFMVNDLMTRISYFATTSLTCCPWQMQDRTQMAPNSLLQLYLALGWMGNM